nr:dNTP triphosphohydrolase [Aeromonas salmonicida]
MGNPPFGHAGEFAIRQWFTENIHLLNDSLSEAQLADLKLFEGNAQGFRIVSQLENHSNNGGLRLTHATLGSLLKYPWHSNHQLAAEKEKFNIFQSESNYFDEVVNKLGLAQKSDGTYSRHPLSYLMEAADDICYKILDIEDALELNILRMEDVKDVFVKLSGDTPLVDLGKDFPARKRFAPFRAKAIDNLIREVVTVFENNYMQIMSGDYNGDLISNVSVNCKESPER